jgi:O-antigen/teichoic acid export membrane protein
MTLRIGELARHTGVYGIGTIVGGIGRAALIPVIARFVPTEEYGKASVMFIFITLFSIVAELGLSSSLIKFFNEARSEAERRRVVSTVVGASLILAVPIALACGFLAGSLSRALLGSTDYRALVFIGIGGGLGSALLQVGLAFERALAKSHRYVAYTLAKGGLALGLSLILVVAFRMGALGLVVGSALPPLLIGVLIYGRLIARSAVGLSRRVLESVFSFGSPLVPMNLAMWVLAYLDIYLLRRLLAPAVALSEVGLYQYAHEICLLLVLPIQALNLAWPQFLFSNHHKPEAPRTFAVIHGYFTFFLLEMAFLLAMFSDKLIGVVGSAEYLESSTVIPCLAGSLVFYGFSILFSSGLYVAGSTRTLAAVVAACALLNAGLNILLIPHLGKVGAATATLVTNAVMALVILAFSQRHYRIPFRLKRTLGGLGLAIATMAALTYGFGSIYAVPVGLRVVVSVGMCLLLSAVLGIKPHDFRRALATLTSLLPKRGHNTIYS